MKRIAIDIDEVLCPFFHPMAKRAKRTPPTRNHVYDYSKALGITTTQSKAMVSEFYTSDTFKNLKPIDTSQIYVNLLAKQGFALYAMTGRQSEVREETERWLQCFFPDMFHDLVISNSYTYYEVPKALLCMSLNTPVLVDDNFHTCIECENHGLTPINFVGDPQYPWCVDSPMAAKNWEEVYKKIISL